MTTVGRTIPLLCLLFLCAPASLAQDDALQRNPQALAERYLGYQGDLLIPPLTPQYQVGDEAQFWVGKAGSDTPARVNATLAAVTRDVYLWIEDGVTPSGNLTQTALQLNAVMFTFLQHDNYRQPVSAPGIGSLTDQTDLLPIPDVDNDPHLYILYASDLNEDRSAVVNPIDSLPVEFAPYSNQHEMLYVNTSPYSGIPLDDPLYLTMLARGIYHWIMTFNAPGQAAWLTGDHGVDPALQRAAAATVHGGRPDAVPASARHAADPAADADLADADARRAAVVRGVPDPALRAADALTCFCRRAAASRPSTRCWRRTTSATR
ncbi:MAG: hypothetical protein U0703_13690 [Anaerolineae bacterium]